MVGAHGAGLANTVFCREAAVIELFQPGFVNHHYFTLSCAAGNRHRAITCAPTDRGAAKRSGLLAPVEDVRRAVVALLGL